ncbi:tRNA modification GTPase mnmE [Deinococcus proteolyticus MRP]|uniref:tRNA modification GTPase MnmE n=1 Tax=Deinococcus proteolyticus (strain ATCC 35074 / DSM 20540 / JCM 6276 / NBRC 101906 / NCIMB 13154 / VKM Ac-1939 / CCM 2703 / MRP) TaxID=693977 RepID=F0RK05_DEIPM|nr:tRNA uridine-5-carboxymethylaminomethyl(34) synthesis GTPase MnmE [Deinococcus proteolyticus]ADY26651.1 tRNA modification GTPase mnmE [Deinococcus proteolyticus MRP]
MTRISSRSGLSDTIAAVATAPGHAGVGVVRVSGPQALHIADALFSGRRRPSSTPGGRFLFGRLLAEGGEVLDEGLCLVFRAPHSYTGEDVAEFQTHGSPAVLGEVLTRALDLGARPARPGEFTLRAYLAGRLDLAQAEAVLNLVESSTETARRQATLGLSGALGERVDAIARDLTLTLSSIAALLDYPEEGVPEEERQVPLARAAAELEALLGTARAGRVANQGARIALIGAPNAGKSSLLNALLGYERSIVTPLAGTTRDYLEAGLSLAGVPVTLVDTAGLRDTEDVVEAAGVRQAHALAQGADVVLTLSDGSQPREPLPLALPAGARAIHLRTKADLPAAWDDPAYLPVSAATGQGLPQLREALGRELLGDTARGEAWLGSERQADAARRALEHVRLAQELPDDLASIELEEALLALAELTGRDVQDDVVDAVFRNFCVGK